MKTFTLVLPLLLCVIVWSPLEAQLPGRIMSVAPTEGGNAAPLQVTVQLRQAEALEHVYFLYRSFGENTYTRMEMDVAGPTARVTVPARAMVPPFLEYYIVAVAHNGTFDTYPFSDNPSPLTRAPEKTGRILIRTEEEVDSQVIFLSPEPSAVLLPEDVLISVSLLRADSIVVRRATRILLDGVDITPGALFSDDIIVYVPENMSHHLSQGSHKVSVGLYNRLGKIHKVASMTFTVARDSRFATEELPGNQIRYNGSVQFESRHEDVSDVGKWYNRIGYQFSGTRGVFRLTSNAFLTSDEKSYLQPQDRFFIGAETPWIRVGYGDSYPAFPNLILSGMRVRGLSASATAGFFNVDVAMGTTSRAVEGSILKTFPKDSLANEQLLDPSSAYAPITDSLWGKYSYGSYARDMFAIRPSFGSGETWQLGFSWLKSKDDAASIRNGIRPQENAVIGTDFFARFDNNRVELSGQGAFSAFNSDISSGSFTDAYIDTVYTSNPGEIKTVRDALKPFITVNDNLRPLSLKTLSTVAYDMAVGLNYFNNNFKFTYLFRGSDYTSFGESFLRKDIRGFNVVDWMRIIDNQLFISLGFERLTDNTSRTKTATTVLSDMNVAVSYYPRTDMPSISVGFSRFVNDNGLSLTSPDSMSAINDETNRFFIQSSYEFGLGARHTASINLSTAKRNDMSLQQFDVKNVTISAGLASRFGIPLQTNFDIAVNLNDLPVAGSPGTTQALDYTTVSINGKYGLVRDILSIMLAVSPTFGNIHRTVLDAGTEWYVLPTLSITFQFSYFRNDVAPHDNYVSLRSRYDL